MKRKFNPEDRLQCTFLLSKDDYKKLKSNAHKSEQTISDYIRTKTLK